MERRSIARLASQVGGIKLPAHISIKGNVFAAVDDAGNRVHIGTTLNCIILDMNEKMSRLFWGTDATYDEDNVSPPLCFSDNGLAPSSRSLEPQAKSCKPDPTGESGCRWSVWGSARSKKTGDGIPACQNGVKLALMLCKLKGKEWIPAIEKAPGAVFFFRIPPASLGAIASYGKTVAGLGKITDPSTGEEVPADTNYIITEITFRGTGTVQFRPVGYITKELDTVIGAIDQNRVDAAIGRDDVPIREALPAPDVSRETLQERPALPQPAPSIAATPKARGRPRKNGNAPAATPEALRAASHERFQPRENPNIVTTEDVQRDTVAREQQEEKEAQAFANAKTQTPYTKDIVENAPEPPADVLDEFMNLDLK